MSEEALRRAHEALDVWRNTYAADMVSADDAYGAANRLADEGGTLAYIARVQESIRAALSEGQAPEPQSTLAERVQSAQAEIAAWSPERRANVCLEGSGKQAPEPVAQEPVMMTAATAVYRLLAEMTCRPQSVMLGANYDAAIAAEIADAFCKKYGLGDPFTEPGAHNAEYRPAGMDAARAKAIEAAAQAVLREMDEQRIVCASGDYIESRGPAAVVESLRQSLATKGAVS